MNFGARGSGGRDRGTKDDERSRKAIEPTVISNRDRGTKDDERSRKAIEPTVISNRDREKLVMRGHPK